jgi:hypothetical protein
MSILRPGGMVQAIQTPCGMQLLVVHFIPIIFRGQSRLEQNQRRASDAQHKHVLELWCPVSRIGPVSEQLPRTLTKVSTHLGNPT